MEQLQDEVSRMLLTLSKPELISVCQYLKCSEPATGGFQALGKRPLIRLAEKRLEEIKIEEDPEVYVQCLKDLLSYIDTIQSKDTTESNVPQEEQAKLNELQERYEKLQKEQMVAHSLSEGKIEALGERVLPLMRTIGEFQQ